VKDQTLRIGVALVVLQKLRETIEAQGLGHRIGIGVPNLTSLQDVLILPEKYFLQQLAANPQLRPDDEQLQELERMWASHEVEAPGIEPPTLRPLCDD
jgi:hypothetical protein